MTDISKNIEKIRAELPAGVELVAVSKFHPASMIMEAYEAGQRNFGESRVQEFIEKAEQLPKDIRWHFIGHLQTNKVKPLIGKTFLIESVDSERLLQLIDRESEKAGVETKVLLQVHVAQEETKFGFYPEEIIKFFAEGNHLNLKSVEICGLMGMASNTCDEERILQDFSTLHNLFEEIRENFYKKDNGKFRYLSMGMSGDWPLAVKNGSNLVRIGSAIFGDRY